MRKLSLWRETRSSSLSKVGGSALDWVQTYALALTMAGIVLVTVAAVAVLMADTAGESARPTLGPPPVVEPSPDPPEPEPELDVLEYVNPVHGYGFEYPATWTIRENDQLTSLENPNGRIRMLFGLEPGGNLNAATGRQIASIPAVTSDRQLIGMTREEIDGSRALLVSGTGVDYVGDAVRFVAITIRGEPQHYAISILVPRRSDPVAILPQIEEIVSSFEILSTGEDISA